jgi:hypothetical protein
LWQHAELVHYEVVTTQLTDEEVLDLAQAHRGMMWTLAGTFWLQFGVNLVNEFPLLGRIAFFAVYLATALVLGYFVFRVAKPLYGTAPAVICAVFMLSPCFSVLVVIALGGNTQDRLRKAGLKVGLFGATPHQLEEWAAQRRAPATEPDGGESS